MYYSFYIPIPPLFVILLNLIEFLVEYPCKLRGTVKLYNYDESFVFWDFFDEMFFSTVQSGRMLEW